MLLKNFYINNFGLINSKRLKCNKNDIRSITDILYYVIFYK